MADAKDAKEKTDEGPSEVKRVGDPVVDKAGDVMSVVREKIEQVVGESQEGLRHVGVAVRENPGLSVGGALGMGVLVGVIIGLALRSGRT
jgi:ElaB/YqjD/DUF883 family membrane-anchored ribosome-binding protein